MKAPDLKTLLIFYPTTEYLYQGNHCLGQRTKYRVHKSYAGTVDCFRNTCTATENYSIQLRYLRRNIRHALLFRCCSRSHHLLRLLHLCCLLVELVSLLCIDCVVWLGAMDTVVLVSVFVLLPLAVVVLLWVFRPAIISRHHASLPKKMNTFSDGKGVIEADNQIHDFAKCDISLVVPAYNEVRSYTSVSLLLKFTAYIACLPLLACWLPYRSYVLCPCWMKRRILWLLGALGLLLLMRCDLFFILGIRLISADYHYARFTDYCSWWW